MNRESLAVGYRRRCGPLDYVGSLDGRCRHTRRNEIRVRVARVSQAHVAERVEDTELLRRENTVGQNQVASCGFDRIRRLRGRLRGVGRRRRGNAPTRDLPFEIFPGPIAAAGVVHDSLRLPRLAH